MEIHTSLFWIVLSGTLAPITVRVEMARRLILSTSVDEQSLGYVALEALLKNQHFNSSHEFSFGARVRDYGLYPRTAHDIERRPTRMALSFWVLDQWYSALGLTLPLKTM
jgi:hypothetical protein